MFVRDFLQRERAVPWVPEENRDVINEAKPTHWPLGTLLHSGLSCLGQNGLYFYFTLT